MGFQPGGERYSKSTPPCLSRSKSCSSTSVKSQVPPCLCFRLNLSKELVGVWFLQGRGPGRGQPEGVGCWCWGPDAPFLKKEWVGLSWWLSGKEPTRRCRRHRFDPWSGKIPHAVEQLSPRATTTETVLESPGTTASEAHTP